MLIKNIFGSKIGMEKIFFSHGESIGGGGGGGNYIGQTVIIGGDLNMNLDTIRHNLHKARKDTLWIFSIKIELPSCFLPFTE